MKIMWPEISLFANFKNQINLTSKMHSEYDYVM